MPTPTKRRKRLKTTVQTSVRAIVSDITHSRGGYYFWTELGEHKQKTLEKRWRESIVADIFTDEFHNAITLACLDENGLCRPEATQLYNWALKMLFHGSEREMYVQWIAARVREAHNGKK